MYTYNIIYIYTHIFFNLTFYFQHLTISVTSHVQDGLSAQELPSWRPSQEDLEDPATSAVSSLAALRPRIDVVDCSSMDANVNGMRHGALEKCWEKWRFLDIFRVGI